MERGRKHALTLLIVQRGLVGKVSCQAADHHTWPFPKFFYQLEFCSLSPLHLYTFWCNLIPFKSQCSLVVFTGPGRLGFKLLVSHLLGDLGPHTVLHPNQLQRVVLIIKGGRIKRIGVVVYSTLSSFRGESV